MVLTGPVHAQRSIEQAANELLTQALTVLGIGITNVDLLEELGYEVQYAIDALIIDEETLDDLELEAFEELPDEDLFGDDVDDETIVIEDDPAAGDDATTDPEGPQVDAPLSDAIAVRLRQRFESHLDAQMRYWRIVATSWTEASKQSATALDDCIESAQTDEDEDICYFNELQMMQFLFAQRLADDVAIHDQMAAEAGAEVSSLLKDSRTNVTTAIDETLEFLTDEEIAQFGASRDALTGIVSILSDAESTGTGSSQ